MEHRYKLWLERVDAIAKEYGYTRQDVLKALNMLGYDKGEDRNIRDLMGWYDFWNFMEKASKE
jgi:hypothetical protein